MNIRLLLSLCCACLATVSANASAALIDNDHGLIFDDYLGITWLQEANLAKTETFGVAGIDSTGGMTWDTANEWIAAMNAVVNPDGSIGYLGFTGWRLPTTPTTVPPDPALSEMGHLFYAEGITSTSPCSSTSPGVCFDNVQNDYYWFGTEYSDTHAWRFSFETGDQDAQLKSSTTFKIHAWAVHDGDIHVIPVPAAVWLFTSGLIGLVGFARRKR